MTPTIPASAQALLRFWFGDADTVQAAWFRRNDAFDAEIATRFGAQVESALRGELAHWAATADGILALVLLLDQCTRNMFRGTPRAFAGDAQALALAQGLIAAGADLAVPPLQRWFVYMPLEHAEDLATQHESVRRFTALAGDAGPHAAALAGALDYALRHRDVIERFGRFPHRNAILGRESTAEEVEFLKQRGSHF